MGEMDDVGDPAIGELDQQVDGAWWLALILTADVKVAADAVAAAYVALARSVDRDELGQKGFRLQFLAAVRRAADEHDVEEAGHVMGRPGEDPAIDGFWRCSPHARAALWLTDAELLDAGEVGAVLNLSPANASYLAARTRDRLKGGVGWGGRRSCEWAASVAAWHEGTLSARDAARVESHLYECRECVKALDAPERPTDLVSAIDAALPPPPVQLAQSLRGATSFSVG
jgi:hypothetical protein